MCAERVGQHTGQPGLVATARSDDLLRRWAQRARAMLAHVGRAALLLTAIGRACARPREWAGSTLDELRRQTSDALVLVVAMTALGGALIAQQTGYQFQGNLPNWVIGAIAAASLVTEVTPLFTAFALVGIVGARITAEIAAMQVTEQVDALEVMGRDAVAHLVVPRVVASVIAAPILVALALPVSMLASWGAALLVTRADSVDFWFGVRHYMRDFPMFYALIKAAAFGAAIALISCYAGLEARGGSQGVGRTARQAVVMMIASIIVLDVALVPLLKFVRI